MKWKRVREVSCLLESQVSNFQFSLAMGGDWIFIPDKWKCYILHSDNCCPWTAGQIILVQKIYCITLYFHRECSGCFLFWSTWHSALHNLIASPHFLWLRFLVIVFGRTYCRNCCLNPSKMGEVLSRKDLDEGNDLISTLVIHLCQREGGRMKRERKSNCDNPSFHHSSSLITRWSQRLKLWCDMSWNQETNKSKKHEPRHEETVLQTADNALLQRCVDMQNMNTLVIQTNNQTFMVN